MDWEMGWRFNMEGAYVYLWLINVDVRQKPTQNWKAIILQLKIHIYIYIKREREREREEVNKMNPEIEFVYYRALNLSWELQVQGHVPLFLPTSPSFLIPYR